MVSSGTITAGKNLALCASGQGKSGWERDPHGAPWKGWTSAEGLWALGACCACVTLPQCAPPANQHLPHRRGSDLPAGAAAENSLLQGGLLAHPSPCCLYGWDLTGGGTSIDFCASLCSFPCFQCLHGAGTGAKTVVLVPEWPLGMHCDRFTPASGSSQLPLVVFSFPVKLKLTAAGAIEV